MSERKRPTRHGLCAVKAKVKVRGLRAIDVRTDAARGLIQDRRDWIADLGGEEVVSGKQRTLIDLAARTKLYVDVLDAFLLEQSSLVNKVNADSISSAFSREQANRALTVDAISPITAVRTTRS